MLVTAIGMYRAIAMQHNAGFALMNNHQNSLSLLRSVGANNVNFKALHDKDVQNDLSNAKNQLMYQIASAQREQYQARLKKELKNDKLNYLA